MCHHNKVVSIHQIGTCGDKVKNNYCSDCSLFLSDVKKGLFCFYPVTQRKPQVLGLETEFSNNDWCTLVLLVYRNYINTANKPLSSKPSEWHGIST